MATMEGLYINGEKAKFLPENIIEGDVGAYAEAVGAGVEAWMDEHLDPAGSVVIDKNLSIEGAAADAKATGDAVNELKSALNNRTGIAFTETEGKYVSGTGHFYDNTNYNCTNYISVHNLSDVYVKAYSGSGCNYEFYDSDHIFISGGHTPDNNNNLVSLPVPNGAYYFRISYYANRGMQVFVGNIPNTITKINDAISERKSKYITLNDLDWIDGYYLAVSADIKYENTGFKYSEKIPLEYMNLHSISLHGRASGVASIVFYDERQMFISSVVGVFIESVEIPSNAKYMAICVEKSKTNDHAEFIVDDFTITNFVGLLKEKQLDNVPLEQIIQTGGMCKIFRTIGVVGDSLSSGEMAYGNASDESTTQFVDMYEYSWIQYMARYCGNEAYNFSAGGLSTRTFFTAQSGKFYNELMDGQHKCQAYFIALGHNDKNQNVPIGSINDINLSNPDLNNDTYYGNYGKIISKIKTVQPNAKIFCVCMKNKTQFGAYNVAIKNIANLFATNVYVLDMEAYAPPLESWEYTQGHGNTMGYLNYSYQISSYVDFLIRKNPSEFKYVQFIGTEYDGYIPNA